MLLLNQCFALVLVVSTTTAMEGRHVAVMAPFEARGAPVTTSTAGGAAPVLWKTNRDKTGANASPRNEAGSQMAKNEPQASYGSFEAEGKGFEPSTGFPAPDFESSKDCPLRFTYSAIAGFFSVAENAIEAKEAARCAL